MTRASISATFDLGLDDLHDRAHRFPALGTAAGDFRNGGLDDRVQFVIRHLLGEVLLDNRQFRAFGICQLTTSGVVIGLGRFPSLLGFATENRHHVIIGEFAGLLARDFLVRDRRENHPDRSRAQVVTRLHRCGQVRLKLVFDGGHGGILPPPARTARAIMVA